MCVSGGKYLLMLYVFIVLIRVFVFIEMGSKKE